MYTASQNASYSLMHGLDPVAPAFPLTCVKKTFPSLRYVLSSGYASAAVVRLLALLLTASVLILAMSGGT